MFDEKGKKIEKFGEKKSIVNDVYASQVVKISNEHIDKGNAISLTKAHRP